METAIHSDVSAHRAACRPMLRFLGPVLPGDRGPLHLIYRKGWALLAWLLVEQGSSHRRSELAALLWPDMDQAAALTNLRQVLCDLRRKLPPLLGEDVLLVGRDRVELRLDPARPFCDLQMIEAMSLGSLPLDPVQSAWLLECGELLDGWDMSGRGRFNQWLQNSRLWYSRQWQRLLGRMRQMQEERGDWLMALACVRAQLRFEPWDEALQRQQMRLYCAVGESELTLASYDALERMLLHELGVVPQQETRELASVIRNAGARRQSDPVVGPS